MSATPPAPSQAPISPRHTPRISTLWCSRVILRAQSLRSARQHTMPNITYRYPRHLRLHRSRTDRLSGGSQTLLGLGSGLLHFHERSARQFLYAGDYDPSFPEKDYVTRGSSPLGKSSFTGVLSFDAFRGPVVVVTGDLDGAAWTDKDAIARTKARFPSAARLEWVRVPQTGHDVNFHRAAPRAFANIFEILNDVMTARR